MHRLVLAAIAATAFAGSAAQAASCPAFPPATVKFVPISGDIERDTSKTAKELAALRAGDHPLPASYDRDLAASVARAVAIQKQPDGTICAGLQEVTFKLGYKRTLRIASEFAADPCVADTIADYEMPIIKSDDAVLAQFGATIPETYGAEVKAIGTATGSSNEEAQKPLLAQVSALLSNKVFPAFEQQVVAATAKVDLSKWQKASCNGATDKAFAAINGTADDLKSASSAMPHANISHSSGSH